MCRVFSGFFSDLRLTPLVNSSVMSRTSKKHVKSRILKEDELSVPARVCELKPIVILRGTIECTEQGDI